MLKSAKHVDIEVKNASLKEVLDLLFKNQPITYSITGKLIKVVPRIVQVEKGIKISYTSPSNLIDIHGRVLNDKGEPVLASIIVKGLTKGTTTNKDGWFVLNGVKGSAAL